MERGEPEGVRSNELGSHTAPVAATHHSDFGFGNSNFITGGIVEGYSSFFLRDIQSWSHEYKLERKREGCVGEKWVMSEREEYMFDICGMDIKARY